MLIFLMCQALQQTKSALMPAPPPVVEQCPSSKLHFYNMVISNYMEDFHCKVDVVSLLELHVVLVCLLQDVFRIPYLEQVVKVIRKKYIFYKLLLMSSHFLYL